MQHSSSGRVRIIQQKRLPISNYQDCDGETTFDDCKGIVYRTLDSSGGTAPPVIHALKTTTTKFFLVKNIFTILASTENGNINIEQSDHSVKC